MYFNNQQRNPHSQPFTPNNLSLNISYKNYDLDHRYRDKQRQDYGKDLLSQIEERKRQKDYEKRKKELEDLEEDMRIKRYHEELERRQLEEMGHKQGERVRYDYRLHTSLVEPKKIVLNEVKKVVIDPLQLLLAKKEEQKLYNRNLLLDMERMKNEMLNRQAHMLEKLNRMKVENSDAVFQSINLGKQITGLKTEIKLKQSHDKVMKDYLYSSLVDTGVKRNDMNKLVSDLYINKSCRINSRYNSSYDLYDNGFLKQYYEDKVGLSKSLTRNEAMLKSLQRLEDEYNQS
jgi:hypothetical protein